MAITSFEGKILQQQEAHDTGARHGLHRQRTVGVDGKSRFSKLQNKNEIGAVCRTEAAVIFHEDKNVGQTQDATTGNEKLNVRSYDTAENNTTTLYHARNHGSQTSVLNNLAPRDVHQTTSEKSSRVPETVGRKQDSRDKLKIASQDHVRPFSSKHNHEGHYLNPCGENCGENHSSQYLSEAMVNAPARRMPPSQHSAKIPPRLTAPPANLALGSWGQGVVGTNDHVLKSRGHVTSRGLNVTVKSSADFYNDFAFVSSYASPIPPSPRGREIEIQDKPHKTDSCDCRICSDARRRERAAVKIQSHLRGYQVICGRIHT